MYLVIEDGKKISMPRYYKNKIYHDDERKAVAYWSQKRQQQEQERAIATGNTISSRDKAENDKAAFAKMYHNSVQGRNKI